MVNTFIIYSDIYQTMKALDYRRLGKQRVEAKQIIDLLEYYDENDEFPEKGWKNHPAVLSWIGYTNALKAYFNICLLEWVNRGYNNTMESYDVKESKYIARECEFDGKTCIFEKKTKYSYPKFVSFPPYLFSHQAALYRKDPKFYDFFDMDELEEYINIGYLWPNKYDNKIYKKWKIKYLDPIGTGAPVQYRITEDEVKTWIKDKSKNPKTGRAIKKGAGIYNDYKKAREFYEL